VQELPGNLGILHHISKDDLPKLEKLVGKDVEISSLDGRLPSIKDTQRDRERGRNRNTGRGR
jgi:hypothetical protein